MLSYRHAFHAGNHADVLKHITLIEILRLLTQKDKGLSYIDTHSGAGTYALLEGYSAMNKEWESGISKLKDFAQKEQFPDSIKRYLNIIEEKIYLDMEDLEITKNQSFYPGSPLIAKAMLRKQDRQELFELHSTDYPILEKLFCSCKNVKTYKEDGFSGLLKLLPPISRRGLIFIDPSYELSSDYEKTIKAVSAGLKKFATGTYAIWYPVLERQEAQELPDRLLELSDCNRIDIKLEIEKPSGTGHGMSGSGLVVINSPWQLDTVMEETGTFLEKILGKENEGKFSIRRFLK